MILNYQEYGSGPPLIILHGLLGCLDNWHTMSRTLASSFRVIAVDQRNHGRSGHSDVFTYGAMAADLTELLDHLQIPSASVLGHSMGGKTAMQCALSYPDRVDKLIAVDIAPREYPRLHDELLDAMRAVDLRSMTARQQVDARLAQRVPDFAERQFLLKNLARDDAGGFFWRPNLEAIHNHYLEIARAIGSDTPFDGPALFVRANKANYILPSDFPAIRHLFPDSTIVGIESGHWIHADAPVIFADFVIRFLDGERVGG
jgi:esterase